MQITKQQVENVLGDNAWSFANGILYNLCHDNPDHKQDEVIIAKMWLIGRTYAAALERRKRKNAAEWISSDVFYTQHIAPAVRNSEIDQKLQMLRQFETVNTVSIGLAVDAHAYLISLLRPITGSENRSFVSKYLHFHLPSLFFIYDSRTAQAVTRLKPRHKVTYPSEGSYERIYFWFSNVMIALRDEIHQQYGYFLSPRQLDDLLLYSEMFHAN